MVGELQNISEDSEFDYDTKNVGVVSIDKEKGAEAPFSMQILIPEY